MSLIEKVALFGAGGAIGRSVAPVLEQRGIPFRVVGRNRSTLESAFGQMAHAEIHPADLADPQAAAAACRGVDTLISSLGLPYPAHHLHPVLMRTTVDAAISSGVTRLLLVSSVYAYGVPRTVRVAESHPR